MNMEDILKRYLLVKEADDNGLCAHCHKNKPEKKSVVCPTCKKELEAFRNKNKPKDEEK